MASDVPPQQHALIRACTDGDATRVEKLLVDGAQIDYVADRIQRPLFITATHGHLKVFRLLLKRGADLFAETPTHETVIGEAARHDHVDIVEICLEAGASLDLDTAVAAGAARTVRLLLARGAKPHPTTIHAVARMPAARYAGDAARSMLDALLAGGADVHAKDAAGHTVFQLASKNHDVPNTFLAALLELGARLDEPDAWGITPLWIAAHDNHTHRVIFLLAAGANPNAKTTRDSALAKANTSVYDANPTADFTLLSALRDAGAERPRSVPAPIDPLRVDAKVTHPKFGTGTITARDGIGDRLKLTIDFAGETRVLLAKFVTPA